MTMDQVFEKLKSNSSSVGLETIRILVKVAENVINNPSSPKVRCLQKTNSAVQNKILSARGGLECLQLMGFRENSTSFVLPANSPLDKLIEVKTALLNLKFSENAGAIPRNIKTEIEPINANGHNDDLLNVKKFILPPFTPKYSNSFLRKIETQFHNALAFDDKDCQRRAKQYIPLATLEINAQRNLRYLQAKIKKEKKPDPDFSMQDMLLLELLRWFKEDFFSWVDSPSCQSCAGKTVLSKMSSDPKDLVYTQRVEVYECQACRKLTKFPRYNDLNILLETRRGRCGEWAQVFTLLCRSLGWDARYVVDELDHVWTEVYSVTQKRWIHCDSCENACDTPLIYENGWNKSLTYVMAYSPEEVQDVTWRYSCKHKEVLKRRKSCSESELVNALVSLRNERQKNLSKARQSYLTKRLIGELAELMVERKAQEADKQGRVSGSEEWRLARGEAKNENMYVWRIGKEHIVKDKVTIQYCAALDSYRFVQGDGKVFQVEDWGLGVFEYENVFRKEETDWKTVYLARKEGTDRASITWRFEVEPQAGHAIDKVTVLFQRKTYENGVVDIKVASDDGALANFPKSDLALKTDAFSGKLHFSVEAVLSGGKGEVAWQHAQLFRQAMDSKDYPFVVTITFKGI